MLKSLDRLRAQFAPNDPVSFIYRRKPVEGTLVRTNPARGIVRSGTEEYTVPYERLTCLAENTTARVKRIESIHELAIDLLQIHALKTWSFEFDHSTRRAGCCRYHDRTITLAFELARTGSDDDIRDTILHEIAHALVGRKHNHDAIWKAKAREIGCSGERTHLLQFSAPRWTVTCENRCWSHTAQQRNPRLICRNCGGKLVYTPHMAGT